MRSLLIGLLIALGLATTAAAQQLGLRRTLQDTVSATGNGTAIDVSKASGVTIYCDGTGTITSGVITIEEARDTAYTGTWSSLTTITASTLTAGADTAVHLAGVFIAVRARISTTIGGGGTVTCELLAN